jgi:hypothetical protein
MIRNMLQRENMFHCILLLFALSKLLRVLTEPEYLTDGGEWSALRPGRALDPGKGPPIPIVQEAGWAPEPAWTQRLDEKPLASAGDRTSIARSSSP